MFDVLFRDKATVRRAKANARSVRNAVVYEELLDESGGTITLRCKIERRGRRVLSTSGSETQTDASAFYNAGRAPAVREDDLLVVGAETFRIVGLNSQRLGAATYARADLVLDRTIVPEDADAT